MKQRRLTILLVTAALMIAVRLWVSNSSSVAATVEAVARPTMQRIAAETPDAAYRAPEHSPLPRPTAASESADADEPVSNPFAVRHPQQPIAPPVQQVVSVSAPVVEPPPRDPTPPYRVIGTYDDKSAPGVFVATPEGVEIARVGTRLDADFLVTAITRQALTLEQIASKREIVLNIPAGAAQ